jgi:putative transposase
MPNNNGRLYNLSHCTYICPYHMVWVTKYRDKTLDDPYIKREMKKIIRTIAHWKGFILIQWHIGPEHIHLYLIIPPKYSVSYAVCILKSKTSGWIKKKTKKFPKGSLWCRGYFISTVGINEEQIRNYIKNQDAHRINSNQQVLFK